MTRPPKSVAIERLQKSLNEIPGLMELSTDSVAFIKWHRITRIAIRNTFDQDPDHTGEFDGIDFEPRLIHADFEIWTPGYESGMEEAKALLESMVEEIEEYWPDEGASSGLPIAQSNEYSRANQVFVVHGREEGSKHAVARYVKTIGLEPVILDEQANQGRTIIAKYEEHARNVSFAVVLLTPDDEGRLQQDVGSKLKTRARQNVIFELGFFAGKLGRDRVCALIKDEVEIPSDFYGVVYVPLDHSGGWKLKLASELKQAGFEVDTNLDL